MQISRLSIDAYFCRMATVAALRSTCARRAVGCVLIDDKNHVLATGYNGVARQRPHCIDVPCPGASCSEGQGLELCEAIHAEQNALLQCSDVDQIYAAYCTTAPCAHCVKLLSNTGCQEIVFIQTYEGARSDLWSGGWRRYIDGRLESALKSRRFP